VIDWLLCTIIALPSSRSRLDHRGIRGRGVPADALTGFTFGKRLLGIRVARLDGKPSACCGH